MSKFSKAEILAEAAKQGFVATSFNSSLLAKFVLCVLKESLTKPLPIAVASCIKKIKIK